MIYTQSYRYYLFYTQMDRIYLIKRSSYLYNVKNFLSYTCWTSYSYYRLINRIKTNTQIKHMMICKMINCNITFIYMIWSLVMLSAYSGKFGMQIKFEFRLRQGVMIMQIAKDETSCIRKR